MSKEDFGWETEAAAVAMASAAAAAAGSGGGEDGGGGGDGKTAASRMERVARHLSRYRAPAAMSTASPASSKHALVLPSAASEERVLCTSLALLAHAAGPGHSFPD
jgi:hypothetical protein